MRCHRRVRPRRCGASSRASTRHRSPRHGRRSRSAERIPPARSGSFRRLVPAWGAGGRSEWGRPRRPWPRIPIPPRSAGDNRACRCVATATTSTPAHRSSSHESPGGCRSARIRAGANCGSTGSSSTHGARVAVRCPSAGPACPACRRPDRSFASQYRSSPRSGRTGLGSPDRRLPANGRAIVTRCGGPSKLTRFIASYRQVGKAPRSSGFTRRRRDSLAGTPIMKDLPGRPPVPVIPFRRRNL